MTKLHSINKLGMAKREHRVSEGLMEVSQALDYKYVRYSLDAFEERATC